MIVLKFFSFYNYTPFEKFNALQTSLNAAIKNNEFPCFFDEKSPYVGCQIAAVLMDDIYVPILKFGENYRFLIKDTLTNIKWKMTRIDLSLLAGKVYINPDPIRPNP